MGTWWQILKPLQVSVPWSLKSFVLSSRLYETIDFHPHQILAEPTLDDAIRFWHGPPAPGSKRRRRRAKRGEGSAKAKPVGDRSEESGSEFTDALSDGSERSHGAGDPGELEPLAEVESDLEKGEELGIFPDPSESEQEGEPEDPPPPPPPAPPPAPPPVAPAAHIIPAPTESAPHKPRNFKRGNFPLVLCPMGNGFLRRSRTHGAEWDDIRANCWRHETCTMTRGCGPSTTMANLDAEATGRPYGCLWRFLQVAHHYPDKWSHKAMMLEWGDWQSRNDARADLFARPDCNINWRTAERPKRLAEPHEEPEGFAGGPTPEARALARGV